MQQKRSISILTLLFCVIEHVYIRRENKFDSTVYSVKKLQRLGMTDETVRPCIRCEMDSFCWEWDANQGDHCERSIYDWNGWIFRFQSQERWLTEYGILRLVNAMLPGCYSWNISRLQSSLIIRIDIWLPFCDIIILHILILFDSST